MKNKEQKLRQELYKKVNEGRLKIKHQILTQDQLDRLSIEELEEELRMIKITPKVDDLLERSQKILDQINKNKK